MRTNKIVEAVLRDKPKARDNDKLLILYVWQQQGLRLTPEQVQKFKDVASPESIRRTRQKLQEQGQYRASAEVEEERYSMYIDTKEKIKHEPEAISWL